MEKAFWSSSTANHYSNSVQLPIMKLGKIMATQGPMKPNRRETLLDEVAFMSYRMEIVYLA